MFIGDFPESLTQAMLVGTMLVGRLGVGQTHGQMRVSEGTPPFRSGTTQRSKHHSTREVGPVGLYLN